MKDTEYAFAVSAVRVRETALLDKAKIESLVTAPTEAAALRFLEEFGYTGITGDPDGVLISRMNEVTDYVLEISPDKELLSFLLVKNDFHNLKAAMKCAVSDMSPDRYFMPGVTLPVDDLRDAVVERSFKALPEHLSSAAKEAWDILTGTMNGQYCEAVLDRCAIEASLKIAEASGDRFCIGLARLRAKLAAVLTAYRSARAGKNADFLKMALPEVSGVTKSELCDAALGGADKVVSFAVRCGIPLPDMADASDIAATLRELEREYISTASFISMGAAPVIAYYLACENEISKIRVILSCKRCALTEDACRRRI